MPRPLSGCTPPSRRTAIVAFSADEVYAIAELIRRQHGGAAVVLGSLSPRTRNAQVAMFQNGDVDYLVATDAIGMGLNLDVDHVAFAADRKFDGYQYRRLSAAELGQIAGRAGRHMRDGTFGVTSRVDPFEDALVEAGAVADGLAAGPDVFANGIQHAPHSLIPFSTGKFALAVTSCPRGGPPFAFGLFCRCLFWPILVLINVKKLVPVHWSGLLAAEAFW